MELPRRPRGTELLRPGQLTDIRRRLRAIAPAHDLVSVIACAFDHRTRMLPFIFADKRMVPAGSRAIGSAMVDSGFHKTRIVLQQWNKNFRPSLMKLDGRTPDLFMVSTMGMHSAQALALINDARKIDPAQRPLIIAGGSHAVYEPHNFFSPTHASGPDVAVTGEEYVLLSLLETILSFRSPGQSLRSAFHHAKDAGALDPIPGLVYPQGPRNDADDRPPEELIDTGIQQLVGDLDELPHPVLGYRLLEPPSRSATLSPKPLADNLVRKYSPISSIILTFGCKFACAYCPIPAYNQRQHRLKSPDRIAEEMHRLNKEFGLRYFFGVDDNFFNYKSKTLPIIEKLASAQFEGKPLRRNVRWYSEVTVHDTLQMKDHLPLVRKAGCRALWLGVEDMTATLVNKGQTVDKTSEAFRLLRDNGICPMPMMMHHDSQPLLSRKGHYGLLNQISLLKKAGAVSLQVLMITPSPGTKLYEETFAGGQVFESVAGKPVEPHMCDGNYVVASLHPQPWKKQLNLLAAYLWFYNPIWFLAALLRKKSPVGYKPAGMQLVGMAGLLHTIRRTASWALRLMTNKIKRQPHPPTSQIPMRHPTGQPAPHAPFQTQVSPHPTRSIPLPMAG